MCGKCHRTPKSVCVNCRKVFADKSTFWWFREYDRKCPDCGRIMIWKYDFKAPRRNNVKAWKQLSVG
jgi:predicted RNA-binding Zn-ribbon protein involved in translation (DUF1610 family)